MCELDLYFIGLSEIHWVCGQDLSKIHQLLWKLRLCSCGRAANPDCHLKGLVVAANDRYPSLAALHQRPVAGLKSCKITPS